MRAIFLACTAFAVLFVVPGCGLTLDYSPPDPERIDAGMDAAAVACTGDAQCDDGLSCTVDGCSFGTCAHVDSCPSATECIARGGGQCRLPCAGDEECLDELDCTIDTCEADGHCAHASTCDEPGRPRCLVGGACVPSECTSDVECDDGNPCNGIESCDAASMRCAAGAPIACDAPMGCIHFECDPGAGGCVRVPHAEDCGSTECLVAECLSTGECGAALPDPSRCDDDRSCTVDLCNDDGACEHEDVICDQTCAPDGAEIVCDESTGTCPYDTACGEHLVCTAEGCGAPTSCLTDASCEGSVDPSGCPLRCNAGRCEPLTCAPTIGECGVLAVSADSICPDPEAGPGCSYRRDDSRCRSPFHGVIGVCTDAFECEYACPTTGCVTYAFDSDLGCVPTAFDSAFCTRTSPEIEPSDCSRWLCTGASDDGCERQRQDSLCDDRIGCTVDRCAANGTGGGTCTRVGSDAFCDDRASCTTDSCDPSVTRAGTRGCRYVAQDSVCRAAAGSLDCASVYCVGEGAPVVRLSGTELPSGCAVAYAACDGTVRIDAGLSDAGLSDAGFWSTDAAVLPFDASTDASVGFVDAGGAIRDASILPPTTGASRICELSTGRCRDGAACRDDSACDDGDPCNGIEICESGACSQLPPTAACGPQTHCGAYCVSGLCAMSLGPSCISVAAAE